MTLHAPAPQPILIADWSMYQAIYHGDPFNFNQLYDPAFYTVVVDWPKVKAACAGVIIRVGIGSRKDPCFDRFLAGLKAAGIPWGIYHAYDPSADPVRQAQLVRQWCPEAPTLGVWGDVEMGTAVAAVTMVYLSALDHAFGLTAGVYSGGPYLDNHFTAAQQDQLDERRLWIAGYPNFWPPYGWNSGANHALHQYTNAYALPGLAKACDMSVPGPAYPWSAPPMPIMPAVMVPHGSLVAIHAINPGDTLQLVKEAVAAGAPYSAVKMLNDAAALMQVKQASPTTWTYLRYFNPDDDSLQGLDDWSEANEDAWCDRVLFKIYSQLTAAQCALIDWACAWNEEDPPGQWGYKKLGETFLRLGKKNEARKAAGLTYVKLAFGCLAQGTPELWEIDELVETGLFAWMHDHFYSWDVHEGPFAWQKVDEGYGSAMPSTPAIAALGPGHGDVPAIPGSGSGSFRFVWTFERRLRLLGQLVPLLIGEWYPGVPGDLARYDWYDDRLSAFEYVAGFAPYNLGPTKDWPDLTPDYLAMRQHRIDIRNRINGGLMPATLTDEELAQLSANTQAAKTAALANEVILAKHKPAPAWKVGDIAVAVANPLQLYDAAHNASGAPRPNYTSDIDVFAVSADGQWLQVFKVPALFVRAADVKRKP